MKFMDEDRFLVSVLDEMSNDELEAFCDAIKFELDVEDDRKEVVLCK